MLCGPVIGLAILAAFGGTCDDKHCDNCFDDICQKAKFDRLVCKDCCMIIPQMWGICGDQIDAWCNAAPPHAHHPGPGPGPHPGPGPGPHPGPGHVHNPGVPECASWPTFSQPSQLKASPWGAYLMEVYGSSPPNDFFPLDIGEWWLLWENLLAKHHVSLPKSSGNCAPPNCQLSYFRDNNAYSPAHTSWIWHPPPYGPFGPWVGRNGWVEVMHEKDPFGDEHHGCWFLFAKGSGVWYQTGNYIEFAEHADAYKHFNAHDNEGMSQAAAAAGYDTIIFLAHHDSTNYPCASKGHYPYMNVEIVATKLQGTYPCGANPPPGSDVLRSGWATDACKCSNGLEQVNCGRLYDERLASLATTPTNRLNSTVPQADKSPIESSTDCSENHTSAVDPAWFANSKT